MNKTGGELSILGDVPPSLSKEFNTSITDDNSSIIHNDTNTSNGIDKTINDEEAVSNSIIDNNNTAISGIDREEEVSQIVNSALEKARSKAHSRADEGDTINVTLVIESDNAMGNNFITVTEIPTIPPKSPKIQSSNLLLVPPKSPSRIIQVNNSNELPIIENGVVVDSNNNNLKSNNTTADQIIDETTIHIGKIGNPIGSLGTLWDSVTTEQEMVNVNVVNDNTGNGEFFVSLLWWDCVCLVFV